MRDKKDTKQKYVKNCDSVEKGIDITKDGENTRYVRIDDGPRSMCFKILFYWGLFEVNFIALVLMTNGRKNYGQQVLQELCEEDCANYITNGLIIRQLLALYMTLGAFRVGFSWFTLFSKLQPFAHFCNGFLSE